MNPYRNLRTLCVKCNDPFPHCGCENAHAGLQISHSPASVACRIDVGSPRRDSVNGVEQFRRNRGPARVSAKDCLVQTLRSYGNGN